MSGLNPSGLGTPGNFGNIDSDSISADEAVVGSKLDTPGANIGDNDRIEIDGNNGLSLRSLNLADDQQDVLNPNKDNFIGIVWVIQADNARMASYSVRGGVNTTTELIDGAASFSTSQGTDGSCNIYWSTANGRYEIENKEGSMKRYRLLFFGDTS